MKHAAKKCHKWKLRQDIVLNNATFNERTSVNSSYHWKNLANLWIGCSADLPRKPLQKGVPEIFMRALLSWVGCYRRPVWQHELHGSLEKEQTISTMMAKNVERIFVSHRVTKLCERTFFQTKKIDLSFPKTYWWELNIEGIFSIFCHPLFCVLLVLQRPVAMAKMADWGQTRSHDLSRLSSHLEREVYKSSPINQKAKYCHGVSPFLKDFFSRSCFLG